MLVLVKRMSKQKTDSEGNVRPSKPYFQLARDGRFVYTNGRPVFGSDLGIGLNPKNGNVILDDKKIIGKQIVSAMSNLSATLLQQEQERGV